MPQPALADSSRPSASGRVPGTQRPAAGELLADRYELAEPLGQGAHGVVFRALDRRLRVEVAVKLVPATGRLAERLTREGQLVSRLHHPGIVRVLDGGERPGGWSYLVLELVRGARPLEAVVSALERAERLECLLAIADALAAAHAQGVVHRDVKAGNVLVDADGRPRLTDFGIARITDDDRRDRLTRTGEVVGTPSAMAPEQFQGGELGPQVDVWALGVLLYELLTDQPPFTGDHPAALFTHVCDRPPIAPRAHDATIPPPLERLCLRALAKRPADRPADAAAFADDLRAALVERPASRSPALLVGAGVALGALLTGVGVATLGRARHAPTPSPPATVAPPPVTTSAPPPPPRTEPPPEPPPRTEPSTEPPPRTETPLERSRALESKGDVPGAILVLAAREGAELVPPESAERLQRLREQYCLPQHERAIADPRWRRVQELAQEGKAPECLPLLDDLVADLPCSSVLRQARGTIRARTGDMAGAVVDTRALVAFAPRLDAGWIDFAQALSASGDEAGGFDALERGIVINGGGGVALRYARGYRFHLRADSTRSAADYAIARAEYDHVLELDPDHIEARLNRAGLRALALNDLQGALSDLEDAVARRPDEVPVLQQVGRIYLNVGRPQAAIPLLEKARGLAWGDASTQAQLDALLEQARAAPGR